MCPLDSVNSEKVGKALEAHRFCAQQNLQLYIERDVLKLFLKIANFIIIMGYCIKSACTEMIVEGATRILSSQFQHLAV